MKRLAWILGLALAAAVVAWLVLGKGEPDGRAGDLAPEEPLADRAHGVMELARSDAPTEIERVPAAASDPRAAGAAPTWFVRVVDGASDAPVAGATLSVVDSLVFGRELSERGVGPDTIAGRELRAALETVATTGADGRAAMTVAPAHLTLEARSDNLWAFTVVNGPPVDGVVTLRLAEDRTLSVRVLDRAGNPVGGVPVALRRKLDAPPDWEWKWTDSAPGSGLAMFLHFQRRLERGPGWHACLAFPVRGEPVIPVDASAPPELPDPLVLPDTGRLRIEVRAADGGALDLEGGELRVDAFEGSKAGERLWPDGPWSRPQLDAEGDALVRWIGLGLQLRVVLVREDVELASAECAGPVLADEEVVCRLASSSLAVRHLTGRFVRRDGHPWPATKASAYLAVFPLPSRAPYARDLPVDAEGRFRVEIDQPLPAGGSRSIRFWADDPGGAGRAVAVVALDRELPPEGLDVGDVVLDLGEPLVAGRVVDGSGAPVEGARFLLTFRTLVQGEESWPRVPDTQAERSRADGAFALRAPPGASAIGDELRLSTEADGHAGEHERAVRRGEHGLGIVLERAGALAGSVLLGAGVEADDVFVIANGARKHVVSLGPDLSFDVRDLAPGEYTIEARVRGARGRFARAAGVERLVVRAGETCRDERIQGLLVESALATVALQIVDRASSPLGGATSTVVGLADSPPFVSGADGVCRVRVAGLPIDVEVSAFGCLRRRLAGVDGDQQVVLEAGLPIVLETTAATRGTEPSWRLGATLWLLDDAKTSRALAWPGGYPLDRQWFDERGEVALKLPVAGTYSCELFVTAWGADGVLRRAPVSADRWQRIDVLAGDREQRFEIAIAVSDVEEAVRQAVR